jgi:hypothetical protein
MARKRMIDPSIWTDDGMAELTPRQQLLFIGLISNADDQGRLKGNATALRLMLPGIYGEVSSEDIEHDLNEVLRNMGKLERYCVDGRPYLVFRNYSTWQKIKSPSPSVLPDPDQDCYGSGTEVLPNDFRNDSEMLPPNRIEGNRREEKRKEPDALTRARPVLRDFGITDEQIDKSLELAPPTNADDLPFMAESFVEYHRSKKTTIKSPYRAWLNWLKNDREFKARDAPSVSVRSPSNGKLVTNTKEWAEEQWEEARRYG